MVRILLHDGRVNPAAYNNQAIRSACQWGHSAVVALLLDDPRVNPADWNNKAIWRASQYGQIEIVQMLLRDQRVDPTSTNNIAIKAAIQYQQNLLDKIKTDSIKLKLVQLLLRDERVDPSVRHNELLNLADVEGCKPVFELMLRDVRVKTSLFFGSDVISEDIYNRTYKDNKGKLLYEHFKQISKTAVLCFNRAWMRGFKVPNDVVRLVVSEWCRIEVKVRVATASNTLYENQ